MFPALLISASLLAVLDVFVGADVAAGVESAVVATLETLLTDRASGVVASVESLFADSDGGVLTAATAIALAAISGAFGVVINALNVAQDTVEQRSWVRQRLLGLVMGVATTVVVVLALAVLVVGPLFGRGEELAELVGLGTVFAFTWNVLRLPVVAAGLVLWAMLLFHLAPNRRGRLRDSSPGAALTAVLWILASYGLHLYLSLAAGANPVLGAFGGGAIVMTWVYLLSLSLLLGGELNAVLQHPRVTGAATG